jgi:hypothetical protein
MTYYYEAGTDLTLNTRTAIANAPSLPINSLALSVVAKFQNKQHPYYSISGSFLNAFIASTNIRTPLEIICWWFVSKFGIN